MRWVRFKNKKKVILISFVLLQDGAPCHETCKLCLIYAQIAPERLRFEINLGIAAVCEDIGAN